jgi:hypothetical protein
MMRNLLGLRPIGIGIALGCALVAALGLLLPSTSQEWAIFSLIVCALVLAILVPFTTKAALKRTAEAYAVAILRICQPSSTTGKRSS